MRLASHMGATFVSRLLAFYSSSLLVALEKQQKEFQGPGSCNPWGRPVWNYWLLAFAWPSHSSMATGGVNQGTENHSLSLFYSLFQINLSHTHTKRKKLNYRKQKWGNKHYGERQWNTELKEKWTKMILFFKISMKLKISKLDRTKRRLKLPRIKESITANLTETERTVKTIL